MKEVNSNSNSNNNRKVRNEYLGIDKKGLENQRNLVMMYKENAERDMQRTKERYQEDMKGFRKTVQVCELKLQQIKEAEEYADKHGVNYQNIIVVSEKDKYKHTHTPMYVGDISGMKIYKTYYYTIYSVDNIDNRRDTNTLYVSSYFDMSEKRLLREQMLRDAKDFKVKKIILCENVSMGTKDFEEMGIIIEKADYRYF